MVPHGGMAHLGAPADWSSTGTVMKLRNLAHRAPARLQPDLHHDGGPAVQGHAKPERPPPGSPHHRAGAGALSGDAFITRFRPGSATGAGSPTRRDHKARLTKRLPSESGFTRKDWASSCHRPEFGRAVCIAATCSSGKVSAGVAFSVQQSDFFAKSWPTYGLPL